MKLHISFLKFFVSMLVGLFLTSFASANMLIDDLSSIKAPSTTEREWKIKIQNEDELQLECTNCQEQVLVHLKIGKRIDFGGLGLDAAKKAKAKCNRAITHSLQCDTVEGYELDKVNGMIATVKILEDFFISSIILGDETTLLKMTTKASTKFEATEVSRDFFEAIRNMVILN